ncbi:MaoC family dehydratase [Sulfodiicoccus acidiphilus]|uniref:MaoC family dehydratase n=1 Tax=Sulfodiicoccus acidiphilus TaxID=1670455 RepID=A0A348B3L3_9CREN|nr:MaoC/PaaZ C-terminal domain-containing protein [Sulfodiicoccus acidiphilus]BBD72765.1 MaoC family dehydratase [Sulfodiicoccus acidiphilus]GGT99636.1 MaoC family dehydratase [Sulfodiicoccus acidiphilus]
MYFEEFKEGEVWESKGRTVTEADIVVFASMTGALNPLFLDEEYGKTTRYGSRIAPGMLTASLTVGLAYQLREDPFGEGFIALHKFSGVAKKAVKIGDSIRARVKVQGKEDQGDKGRVRLILTTLNQRGEEVMSMEMEILAKKKGS